MNSWISLLNLQLTSLFLVFIIQSVTMQGSQGRNKVVAAKHYYDIAGPLSFGSLA